MTPTPPPPTTEATMERIERLISEHGNACFYCGEYRFAYGDEEEDQADADKYTALCKKADEAAATLRAAIMEIVRERDALQRELAKAREALQGFVLNVRHLNDPHFEGVQERLVALAQAALAAQGATGGERK